ncbi:MAG: hypothetical protein HPY59_16325 [Anaerolineae bacterium]|nr:hypothetical protein [Anaerolineae bacterium]
MLFSRVDEEIEAMAKRLADEDQRSVSSEIAWLIRQEWARRYSQPNPAISVADAMLAGDAKEE